MACNGPLLTNARITTGLQQLPPSMQPTLDDIIKALPLAQRLPVAALKALLDQRESIEQEQQQQILLARRKYQQQIQPLLQRASELIRGAAVDRDEVQGVETVLKAGERVEDVMRGKVIEDYWIGVLSNSALVDEINENDQKALRYLLDIQRVQDPHDLQSIELRFVFKPNPYFTQTELRRRLNIKNDQVLSIDGDKIVWKQHQCLTHEMKKITNKKTGEKTTTQGKRIRSFFDIFLDCDRTDTEGLERVAGKVNEIATLILMDSVDYFLGVINADEESQDEDEDGDDGEDGEGEDDGEEK